MKQPINKFYVSIVLLLMLIFPIISIIVDHWLNTNSYLYLTAGKWFVFWALGTRLFTAGIRQALKPELTLKQIFHIEDSKSQVIVKELGYANICMGLLGILSLWVPQWQTAAAMVGGLYMGIAGMFHIIKKPVGPNEMVAIVSDVFIFLIMAAYLCYYFVVKAY